LPLLSAPSAYAYAKQMCRDFCAEWFFTDVMRVLLHTHKTGQVETRSGYVGLPLDFRPNPDFCFLRNGRVQEYFFEIGYDDRDLLATVSPIQTVGI
jgi:hypothetical protein